MSTHLRFASAAIAAFAVTAPLASAADLRLDTRCEPQLGALQQRLLDKATQGPDALRQFVWMTRGIYGLNIEEEWSRAYVELQRAVGECRQRHAAAPGVPAPAADALTAQAR